MKNKRHFYILALCWLAYTTAYMGRLNFSASQVAIRTFFDCSKAETGLVLAFFFFCYGAGQLFNGIFCHKYNSRIVIFFSLVVSAVINIVLPLFTNVAAMKFLWGVNGLVQSVLWSSLIQILSKYMPEQSTARVSIVMSTTVAIGTILAYGLSSLFVYLGNWKIVFIFSGAALAVVSVLWLIGMGKALAAGEEIRAEAVAATAEKKSAAKSAVWISFAFVFICAIANGLIKDGVISWMPEILKESYSVAEHVAIIITLVLPIISIGGAFVAAFLMKRLKNHMFVNALCFGLSGIMLVVILNILSATMAGTILCFAVVSCMMAVINNVLTSIIPLNLRNMMSSGRAAGIINTFCYVGSSIAGYGLGALSDASQTDPWTPVFKLLLILAVAVAAVALAASLYWKKKMMPRLAGEKPKTAE